MRNGEPVAELACELNDLPGREWAGENTLLERRALDVLEHEIQAELRVFPHIVQHNEVRVRDPRRRVCLMAHPHDEPFPHIARDSQVGAEVLDCHRPVEHWVVCEKDTAMLPSPSNRRTS